MKKRSKVRALAGVIFFSGIASVTFANALELSAVDYGAKLSAALSTANVAEAQKLIMELKSCGVEALVSTGGQVSLTDLEVAVSGSAALDFALVAAASSFLIDGNSVPTVNCEVVSFVDGSGSSNTLPVGSTG